ncbi:hypothetical protein Leryth_005589 [Lithospermum erythrorhizon]|nr:hypothetical protein Leryth_005589 [Lithospermum erythrorhizon]
MAGPWGSQCQGNFRVGFSSSDPGTTPARRIWTSLDVGTEIFVSEKEEVAEWTLSDFDVILTTPPS